MEFLFSDVPHLIKNLIKKKKKKEKKKKKKRNENF